MLTKEEFIARAVDVLKTCKDPPADYNINNIAMCVEFLDRDGNTMHQGIDLNEEWDTYQKQPTDEYLDNLDTGLKFAFEVPASYIDNGVARELQELMPIVMSEEWFQEQEANNETMIKYPVEDLPFLSYNLTVPEPVWTPGSGIQRLLNPRIELQHQNIQDIKLYEKYGVSKGGAFKESMLQTARRVEGVATDNVFSALSNLAVYDAKQPAKNQSALLAFPDMVAKLKVNGAHVVCIPSTDTFMVTGSRDFSGLMMLGQLTYARLCNPLPGKRVSHRPLRLVGPEGKRKWVPYVPNLTSEYPVPVTHVEAMMLERAFMSWMKETSENPVCAPCCKLPQYINDQAATDLGCTQAALDNCPRSHYDRQCMGERIGLKVSEVCYYCGKVKSGDTQLSMCNRCKLAYYCGKQCQTANWPRHKQQCKVIAKTL